MVTGKWITIGGEAIANIQEAIELYLEVLQEEGRPIPDDLVETMLLAV
jgi:predicted RNase H-like HicB family nuclease